MSDGKTSVAVGEENGRVVLRFPKPIDFAAFDPENARQVGEAMAKAAYHLHTGKKAPDGRSALSAELKMRLVTRATHIIRNLTDKKVLPGRISQEVVDSILSEIY